MIAWNSASLDTPSPASLLIIIAHSNKMPIPGGPACQRGHVVVLNLHIFRNFLEKKINIAAVNISKMDQSFV